MKNKVTEIEVFSDLGKPSAIVTRSHKTEEPNRYKLTFSSQVRLARALETCKRIVFEYTHIRLANI